MKRQVAAGRRGRSPFGCAFWVATGVASTLLGGCEGDLHNAEEATHEQASALPRIDPAPPITPGTTSTSLAINQGSVNYTVPLVVPPGTAGMTPSLSLSYTSGGGAGIMSPGWSLQGLSAVTRCPATFATDGIKSGIRFDADDRFCLDGQRLVAVVLSQEAKDKGAVAEYRTEVETFARVLAYGTAVSPTKWTVETHTGSVNTYAGTFGAEPFRTWSVSRVQDRAGNAMVVSYTGTAEEAWVDHIDYSEKTGYTTPQQRIDFVYEDREDTAKGYIGGQAYRRTKRLKTIGASVTLSGSKVRTREYRLAYETATPYRLVSIQECGADSNGGLCYAPLRFDYHGATAGFKTTSWGSARAIDSIVSDFNGDGRGDVLEVKPRSAGGKEFWVSLARRDATGFDPPTLWGAAPRLQNIASLRLGDLNADGRTDVVAFQSDGVAWMWVVKNAGNGFGPEADATGSGQEWGRGFPTTGKAVEGKTTLLADANGDGLTDAVVLAPSWKSVPAAGLPTGTYRFLYRQRSDRAGYFVSPVVTTSWSWSRYVDATGWWMSHDSITPENRPCNGSTDKGTYGVGCSNGTESPARVLPIGPNNPTAGTGTVCQSGPRTVPPYFPQSTTCHEVDIYYQDSNFDTDVDTYEIWHAEGSLTNGIPSVKSYTKVGNGVSPDNLQTGDLDGDGLIDLVPHAPNQPVAFFRRGSGYERRSLAFPSHMPSGRHKQIVDLNGDGLDDLASVEVNTTGGTLYLAYSRGDGSYDTVYLGTNVLAESKTRIPNTYQFVDYDGDGLPELLEFRDAPPQMDLNVYRINLATAGVTLLGRAAQFPRPAQRIDTRTKSPSGLPIVGTGEYLFKLPNSTIPAPQRMCKEWGLGDATMGVGCGSTSPQVAAKFDGILVPGAAWIVADRVNQSGGCDWSTQSSTCYGYDWCSGPGTYVDWVECSQPIANQVGDFNGDGVADYMSIDPVANTTSVALGAMGAGNNTFLLRRVTDGLGAMRELQYGRATDAWVPASYATEFPLVRARTPMPVVRLLRESTSYVDTANAPIWRDTSFYYNEPRLHAQGRGFAGFGSIHQFDYQSSAKAKKPNLLTTTWFRQSYPFVGTPYQTIRYVGEPWNTAVTSIVLSKTFDDVTFLLSDAGRPFPYVRATATEGTDEDGVSRLPRTEKTNTYDAWGNLRQAVVRSLLWDSVRSAYVRDGFVKTITHDYEPADRTRWVFDRVKTATVQMEAQSDQDANGDGKLDVIVTTRKSSFQYRPDGALAFDTIEPEARAADTASRAASGAGNVDWLETEHVYDAFGNEAGKNHRATIKQSYRSIVATRGTLHRFDPQGRFAVSSVDTAGNTTRTQYDDTYGLATQTTDTNGLVTTHTIDAMGRKIGQANPDGSGFAVVFGACPSNTANCPTRAKIYTKTTQNDGAETIVYQDELGREIRRSTRDFAGVRVLVDTAFDTLGRKQWVTRPYKLGSSVLYIKSNYDVLGREIEISAPEASTSATFATKATTVYRGLVVESTDFNGVLTSTAKNSQGLVSKTTDGNGKSIRFRYDGAGNLLVATDSAGNAVTYAYDARGRKTASVDPDRGRTDVEYNGFGDVMTERTPRMLSMSAGGRAVYGPVAYVQLDSVRREFEYDDMGRLINRFEPELWPGTTSGLFWNTTHIALSSTARPSGKVCNSVVGNVTSARQTLAFAFDELCRVVSVTRQVVAEPTDWRTPPESMGTVITTYDSVGRIQSRTYPSGLVLQFSYGPYGHLKEVRNGTTGDIFWSLRETDADGNVTREWIGNGLYNHRRFDPQWGRLAESFTQTSANAVATAPLQAIKTTFDAMGNLKSRVRTHQDQSSLSETFGYDNLSRLRTVTPGGSSSPSLMVDYDDIGNITNKSDVGSYSYDVAVGERRLPHAVRTTTTAGGATSYDYNENGELTAVRKGGVLQRELFWGLGGQPTKVRNALTGATTSFAYDSTEKMRTVETTSGDETTIWAWSSFDYEKVTKKGSSRIEHRHYIHAGSILVGQHSVFSDGATSTRYFHHDQVGSVVGVSDSNRVFEEFSYDAFGQRRPLSGVAGTILASRYRPGFTGHESLDSVGLISMKARLYDPMLGRFVSGDPTVQLPFSTQGYNRYAYSNNNPVSYFDPTGYGFLRKLFRVAAAIAVVAVMVYAPVLIANFSAVFGGLGASAFWAGTLAHAALGAIAGGFMGYAMSGTLRGAAMGALQGGLMGAVGSIQPTGPPNWILHGLVGGGMASLQGGDFVTGFGAAFAGAVATAGIQASLEYVGADLESIAARATNFVGTSIVGGLTAEMQGGSFKNGATSAAYGYLFNQAAHELSKSSWASRVRGGLTTAAKAAESWAEKAGSRVSAWWTRAGRDWACGALGEIGDASTTAGIAGDYLIATGLVLTVTSPPPLGPTVAAGGVTVGTVGASVGFAADAAKATVCSQKPWADMSGALVRRFWELATPIPEHRLPFFNNSVGKIADDAVRGAATTQLGYGP